jgi:transcriptional regulator with XRE-family HTH domain
MRQIIRTELERRGWSQSELARQTGLLRHRVCEYLNGGRDVYAETLLRILDALELEIRPRRRRRKGR